MSNPTVVPNAKSTKAAMLAWIEERELSISSILVELKKSKEEISLLEGMVKTLQHTDELKEQLINKLEQQVELLSSSKDIVCREMPEESSDARPDWLISLSNLGFGERGLLMCWEKKLVKSHFNQTYHRLSMNRATLEQFKKKAGELKLENWTSVTGQTWEFKWRK